MTSGYGADVPTHGRPPHWSPRTRVDVDALAKLIGARKVDPSILRTLAYPYEPETREVGGESILGVIALEKYFDTAEFYTRHKHALRDDVEGEPLAPVAEEVLHNAKLLRDAWNTAGPVWRMVRRWIEPHVFRVDPFSNEGTRELPDLVRKLDGSAPDLDGLANDAQWPTNWRGDLTPGQAAAAVNGPHSNVEKWLRLCARYGTEEIVAAFVPDAADVWWYEALKTAALVFRFGRVHCGAPPGVKASSPRGTSAVLLWLPPTIDVSQLPEHTRRALAGESFTVAYDMCKGQDGVHRDRLCTVSPARNTFADFGYGVQRAAAGQEPATANESKAPKRNRKSKKTANEKLEADAPAEVNS